jgi:hypothetical protein
MPVSNQQLTRIGRLAAIAMLLLPLVLMTSAGNPEAPISTSPEAPISTSPEAADFNYIGVDGCKMCHRSPAKGNQLGKWEESAHSKTFAALASDKAKEIAQAKGIADPQQAEACLKCHVTATTAPADQKEKTYKVEDGVGCESCHGAGSAYKAIAIMRDQAKSIENGLIVPDEKVCLSCHNEESPTFAGFDFAEASKKIAHPNPQK